MSLFKDDQVLIDMLIRSGIMTKQAQQAQQSYNEIKTLALSLAGQLQNHYDKSTQSTAANPEADIYVRDLTDLLAFVNYLSKTGQRYNDKRIVFASTPNNASELDSSLYVSWKNFLIYRDGILWYLRNLDSFAHRTNDAAAQTMRPLIKNLIDEINQTFGTKFVSIKDMNLTPEQNQTQRQETNNTKSISDQSSLGNKAAKDYADKVINSLPFADNDNLSPLAMQQFIASATEFVNSEPKLKNSTLGIEFPQFLITMSQNSNRWNAIIDESNAHSYRDTVPYNMSATPNSNLEAIFGSNAKARRAAQTLLQMVMLMEQAITSLTKSPEVVSLISKSVLDTQKGQARAFAERLTTFARS